MSSSHIQMRVFYGIACQHGVSRIWPCQRPAAAVDELARLGRRMIRRTWTATQRAALMSTMAGDQSPAALTRLDAPINLVGHDQV
jgi:hypothetical protein